MKLNRRSLFIVMRLMTVGILCSVLTLSAEAQSAMTLYYDGASADVADRSVRNWMKQDKAIQKALHKRQKADAKGFSEDMSDLRDSLGPKPTADELRAKLNSPEPEERVQAAEKLPGMKQSPLELCRSLDECHEPPVSIHVANSDMIEDAVIALIRPWALVQKSKGSTLSLASAVDKSDRWIRLTLDDMPKANLEVRVSPIPNGGYTVWLHGSVDPAGLFNEARRSALAPSFFAE